MVCLINPPAELPPYKVVPEYKLPTAGQTHEMAYIKGSSINNADDLLFISQQKPSRLLKMRLDVNTGNPLCLHSLSIGSGPNSGLHGLAKSSIYPGCIWATLEDDNVLLLLDTSKEVNFVRERIPLPNPAQGPHGIIEVSDDLVLFTTCKGSGHIVMVKIGKDLKSFKCTVTDCNGKPVYVAVHPGSSDLYVNFVDQEDKILRLIDDGNGGYEKRLIPIPSSKGSAPAAVVQGPDGNVWFTLLKSSELSNGNPQFARISEEGELTWFSLPAPLANRKIGIIHLAFDACSGDNEENIRIWLLGSSAASKESVDAVFAVTIEGNRVATQQTIVLPTQGCAAHRVVAIPLSLLVTELGASQLAQVMGLASGQQRVSGGEHAVPHEASDIYGLWGLGSRELTISYCNPKPGNPPKGPTDGLVGWWKMDETSGCQAHDSSPSQAHGSISNSTWDLKEHALVFNGAGKVCCGTKASLSDKTNFTVCARVKVAKNCPKYVVIIQQRGPDEGSGRDGYNGEYRFSIKSSVAYFEVFGEGQQEAQFVGNMDIKDNEWHHVAALGNGDECIIYVDGHEDAKQKCKPRNLKANIPVFIGADGRSDSMYFIGSLADVRVYNRALSSSEIHSLQ